MIIDSRSNIANALAGEVAQLTVILLAILLHELGGVDVGGRFQVGVHEHGGDTHQDGLNGEDGVPLLRQLLLRVERVLDGRVQDGDADLARGVDCVGRGVLLGWNISVLKTILGGW